MTYPYNPIGAMRDTPGGKEASLPEEEHSYVRELLDKLIQLKNDHHDPNVRVQLDRFLSSLEYIKFQNVRILSRYDEIRKQIEEEMAESDDINMVSLLRQLLRTLDDFIYNHLHQAKIILDCTVSLVESGTSISEGGDDFGDVAIESEQAIGIRMLRRHDPGLESKASVLDDDNSVDNNEDDNARPRSIPSKNVLVEDDEPISEEDRPIQRRKHTPSLAERQLREGVKTIPKQEIKIPKDATPDMRKRMRYEFPSVPLPQHELERDLLEDAGISTPFKNPTLPSIHPSTRKMLEPDPDPPIVPLAKDDFVAVAEPIIRQVVVWRNDIETMMKKFRKEQDVRVRATLDESVAVTKSYLDKDLQELAILCSKTKNEPKARLLIEDWVRVKLPPPVKVMS